jgi:hypothetical protein
MARYRLTYSIKPPPERDRAGSGLRKTLAYMKASIRGGMREQEPFISSSVEQSINTSDVFDILQIDVGSLEPGKYRLILEVEDLVGGSRAVEDRVFRVRGSVER